MEKKGIEPLIVHKTSKCPTYGNFSLLFLVKIIIINKKMFIYKFVFKALSQRMSEQIPKDLSKLP